MVKLFFQICTILSKFSATSQVSTIRGTVTSSPSKRVKGSLGRCFGGGLDCTLPGQPDTFQYILVRTLMRISGIGWWTVPGISKVWASDRFQHPELHELSRFDMKAFRCSEDQ